MFKVDINRLAFERVRSAADLLVITRGDLQGPILTAVAQVHRQQELEIFASEGGRGASGPWARLSPSYAERKRNAGRAGRKAAKGKGKERKAILHHLGAPVSQKILIWSGDMRDRFLKHSRPENIEQFVVKAKDRGVFQLGAASDIASYHFSGNKNLPQRDMVTKTREQVLEVWRTIADWYQQVRLPQALKAMSAMRGSR